MAERRDGILMSMLLLTVLACATGCPAPPPGAGLVDRVAALPPEVHEVARAAAWSHGDPYAWAERRNVVLDMTWTERSAARPEPRVTAKRYTIDLQGPAMRIDDSGADVTATFDGRTWRLSSLGRVIALPKSVTPRAAPAMALYDAAAGEMRLVRFLFSLPYSLLEPGVHLERRDDARSVAGSTEWRVLEVRFEPDTGFLPTDALLIYFNARRGYIDRLFVRLADDPFHAVPHWGEWADYRRDETGLLVPHVWEFRMTGPDGTEQLERTLTARIERMAFDVDLPNGVFADPSTPPPEIPDQPEDEAPTVPGREPVELGR